jgi:DNA-binding IclR family transcriptional regulator
MVSKETHGAAAVEKGLELFLALAEGTEGTALSAVAAKAGLPLSTAHRIAGAYLRRGLLARTGHGYYAPGPRLAALARHSLTAPLIAVARQPLRRLAQKLGATAHLGILEDNMVTYLVKEHGGGPEILTREMNQLEGYGSAIGKMLLAHLPQDEREAYLAGGPFVPLTANTITDPSTLRTALQDIRIQDYAFDNAEVDEHLFCLAVPVRDKSGTVRAAISISRHADAPASLTQLKPMRDCATRIGRNMPPLSNELKSL